MAKITRKFDASNKGKMLTVGALIPGKYIAEITGSEEKQNKSKTGSYISFEWTVIKGEWKGRKFWTLLNLVNESDQAEAIAEAEYWAMHDAFGLSKLTWDTEKLHGIPALLTLKIEKSEGYDDKNRVTAYEPVKAGKKDKEEAPPWQDDEPKEKKKKKKKEDDEPAPPSDVKKKKKKKDKSGE